MPGEKIGEDEFMANKTIKGWIAGRVQGVNYRASMCAKANSLRLNGWVKNLADGRVAFWVDGEEADVIELIEWSRSGPTFARVDQVHTEDADQESFNGFEIH